MKILVIEDDPTVGQFVKRGFEEQRWGVDLVANGDEGDPGSYIDKYLMERNPALLLEGMALAGYAVGANHGFVLCRSEYPLSKPALDRAIESARAESTCFRRITSSKKFRFSCWNFGVAIS